MHLSDAKDSKKQFSYLNFIISINVLTVCMRATNALTRLYGRTSSSELSLLYQSFMNWLN